MPRRKRNKTSDSKGGSDGKKAKTTSSNKVGAFRASSQVLNSYQLGGFSDSMRVTLRYSELVAITCTTGATAYYAFRGNGPFDPNFTGTGGQPYAYDDWSAEYARYRCFGSTFRVMAASVGVTAPTQVVRMCVGPRHVSTNPADLDSMIAAPYAKSAILGSVAIHPTAYRGLTGAISTAQFLGMTGTTFQGDPDVAALVSTVPAHQWFWVMGIQPIDVASTVVTNVTITVDYDLYFWDRIDTTIDEKYSRALVIRQSFLDRNKDDKEDKDPGVTTVDPHAQRRSYRVLDDAAGENRQSPVVSVHKTCNGPCSSCGTWFMRPGFPPLNPVPTRTLSDKVV